MDDAQMGDFIDLSSAITGFSRVELLGTGVAEQYWQAMVSQEPELTANLLDVWHIIKDDQPLDEALQTHIFSDDKASLRDLARNLITAWYTGQWQSDATTTISSATFRQGLVWKAANAHPMGAQQQGFGTWSLPSDYLRKNLA